MSRGTAADWILTGAAVWTGAGGPPGAAGRGRAVALRKGRILAVGSTDDVESLRGPRTAVLELEGRVVCPGFVDAHVHLVAGGLALFRADLRGCGTSEEFVRRVADQTRGAPSGSWILGGDWNEGDWGGEAPSREWLDRAAPDHPVFLHRTDLHTGIANSRALALAGIGPDTPDPEGGIIDRDPDTGEATGILREHAIPAVTRMVPPPSDEERRAAVRAASRLALAGGVTQVHDMGAVQREEESWASFRLLRALRREGGLPLRVYAALPLAHWKEVSGLVGEEGRGDARLGWGMVKGFVDGSLGSSTAWFHDPYADDPENVGTPITDLEDLEAQLRGALGEGLQPAVHAIGDRAADWVFRLWERLASPGRRGSSDVRFRVEHAQHLSPEGMARSGLPGMILSVQPYHLVGDAPWVRAKLGPEREERALAFRSMEGAGARLAFGSDWPVAPLGALATLQAAVTRSAVFPGGPEEGGTWLPAQRLTPEAALRAHTLGGARAGFLEAETGTLEAGKRADLVVLSQDPFRTEPEGWGREVRVEMTFVDGVLAFRADEVSG